MKRKICGLTMEVLRQYDNEKHGWYYEYSFINPIIDSAVNYIMHVLLSEYGFKMVENKTETIKEFANGNFICKGSLIAKKTIF